MAIAGIPSNFFAQQGNGQVLLNWNIAAGATSYSIQRSVDNVNYTFLATVTVPQYLDTSVTLGTQYWYQVASVNGSGTSGYTTSQSVVPVPTGEMCLSQIRLAAQQRADRVNSTFVSTPEWNSYINQSMFELYDLLVDVYEDYYVATPIVFNSDGSTYLFPLPNGTNYNGAPSFYKIMGVDLSLNNANNAWVTIKRFNFIDRNKFVYPNTASTIYGVFNLQYRVLGDKIEFIPTPTGGQQIRIWYIPRLQQLLLDTDITTTSISGWIEYVITDAAIKALQKEESPVDFLMGQKMALMKRIEEAASNRDVGQPDTISNTASANGYWDFNGPFGGFKGGY